MNDNSGEFGAFLAGFVIGGLVGAAVALILAPQSGSETRSQIAGKSHDLREAGGRRVHQTRESTDVYVHGVGDIASEPNSQDQQPERIILDSGKRQESELDDTGNGAPEGDASAPTNA
jgi:gas vesicle protein